MIVIFQSYFHLEINFASTWHSPEINKFASSQVKILMSSHLSQTQGFFIEAVIIAHLMSELVE
jgi:hypothetical protein